VLQGTLILLASNSPRRKELMGLGDWTWSTYAPHVDESRRPAEPPQEYVVRLARAKVSATSALGPEPRYVIGADTTVADGDALLGKPADAAEAVGMLRRLRGHAHQVHTGLAALDRANGRLLTDLCTTSVPMRAYDDVEIDEYVRSGDPFDKAGAYAIQHEGFRPVEGLRGCYASVMGLPLCHVLRLLSRLEVEPQSDLPSRCQNHLNYACPVSAAILRGEQAG
jgi:septum formation protein